MTAEVTEEASVGWTLECEVMGHVILLQQSACVFAPTLTTQFLTDHIDRKKVAGAEVLDLGCGSGPIAIALALHGAANVCAVDLMKEACDLARANAELNGAADKVTVLQGDLFGPVAGKQFDLIVDDVSGVAEEVARVSSWFPDAVPSGGADGTTHAVRMLAEAPLMLRRGGSLIFPVLSLSNHVRVIDAARQAFGRNLQCVARRKVPFNPALRGHLSQLEKLRDSGVIDYQRIRSRYFWTLEVYRGFVPA